MYTGASGEAIISPAITKRLMRSFATPTPATPPQAFPDLTEPERVAGAGSALSRDPRQQRARRIGQRNQPGRAGQLSGIT